MQATSIEKLMRKKFVTLNFEGDFKALIGTPECSGSWIIYGDSGQGKTTFSLQLAKYLTTFKKCAYIPLEEGTKLTFQQALKNANMLTASSRLKIWEGFTVDLIDEELAKPKSPQVIFIDSAQYLRKTSKSAQELTKFEYMDLLHRHPKTLFIFISHAKNKEPKGALAESIYFGSDVCLYVDDYKIYPQKSRYGGKQVFEL